MQHYWPGNVRELDNIVQRALIICDGEQISAADILLESAPNMMDSMPDAELGHAKQSRMSVYLNLRSMSRNTVLS